MKIDYAVLCDACSTENGKHFIHGGGWDVICADSLPLEYPQLCLAVRVLRDREDRQRSFDLELDVLDPVDASIVPAPVRGTLLARPDSTLAADLLSAECVAFRAVYVRISAPGRHAAVLKVDGAELARVPFSVVLVQRDAAAPAGSPVSAARRDGGERWLWTGARERDDAWRWVDRERPVESEPGADGPPASTI